MTPPLSSALGPFAHLPAYEFDFDYRGDSIRPPPPPAPSALVDDFDSYMFPSLDPALDPNPDAPYSSSSSSTTHAPPPAYPGAPPPPPEVDWPLVDRADLFTPSGDRLEPDKLYTGYTKHVILVFVPRHAVELAGLVFGKVAHLLHQAGARIVFISAWTSAQASTFLSRFERISTFPGSLVCDSRAALFTAFGMTRSPLRALFAGSKVSAPMKQGVRNALSTVSYRAQNRDIASTGVSSKRLKCGAVVLQSLRGYAKRPVITYCNEEAPATGLGCYLDVLSICGVNEAFVPDVDVAQVFSRFNSMRAKSIKERHAEEKEANRMKAKAQQGRSSRRSDGRNALKGS